jgi:hypothetical protein
VPAQSPLAIALANGADHALLELANLRQGERVFYAGQRTPPPASRCSPVNQWESSEARNTAIDAMSSG